MEMGLFEIIGGSILLAVGIAVVILCLLQDQKSQQNMTSALTGTNNESFYGKNAGETKEAAFKRLTKILAISFFIGTMVVGLGPTVYERFR